MDGFDFLLELNKHNQEQLEKLGPIKHLVVLVAISLGIGSIAFGLYMAHEDNSEARIEECIAENNFAKARTYLGDLSGKKKGEEAYPIYKEKINRAEINYFCKQSEFERAQATASENDAMDIYLDIIGDQIVSLIRQKKYEDVKSILLGWKIIQSPVYSDQNCSRSDIEGKNANYNSEINTYNDNIFKLFNSAILEKDEDIIKQCLILFQGNIVVETKTLIKKDRKDNSNDIFSVKYKRDNIALREAKKKLVQAGMQNLTK